MAEEDSPPVDDPDFPITDAQRKALKKRAKDNPANQNPDRTSTSDDPATTSTSDAAQASKSHPYFQQIGKTVTSQKANQVVLLSMGGTLAIVAVARISGSKNLGNITAKGGLFKVAIGATFATVLLLGMSEASPELASGFAILILLTTFMLYGSPFFAAIQNAVGSHPGATPLTGTAGAGGTSAGAGGHMPSGAPGRPVAY